MTAFMMSKFFVTIGSIRMMEKNKLFNFRDDFFVIFFRAFFFFFLNNKQTKNELRQLNLQSGRFRDYYCHQQFKLSLVAGKRKSEFCDDFFSHDFFSDQSSKQKAKKTSEIRSMRVSVNPCLTTPRCSEHIYIKFAICAKISTK